MDLDHVWSELQRRQHLQHRPREIHGPGVVVAKPVHAFAVVQLRAVDEVDHHLSEAALEDGRGNHLRPQRHGQVADDRPETMLSDVDLTVSRHHRAHVVAQAAQLLGERGGHVGHAARLCKRRQLGRGDQHLQLLRTRRQRDRTVIGDAQSQRTRGRHLLDVAPVAGHHQSHLHRLAAMPAEH
jgi:hypothetical protein